MDHPPSQLFTTLHLARWITCALLYFGLNGLADICAQSTLEEQDRKLYEFSKEIMVVPKSLPRGAKDSIPGLVSWWVYERMGNQFVASYLLGSSDATPTRAYGALESDDGRLSLGYNIPFQKGVEQWKGLITIGGKADISKGFATISKEDKGFEEDLGGVLKLSFIGNPMLNFTADARKPVTEFMKYQEALLKRDAKEWIDADKAAHEVSGTQNVDHRSNEVAKKEAELQEALITATIAHLENKKLYTSLWNWWVTAECYLPFTRTALLVADSADQARAVATSSYPLTAEGRIFLARKWTNGTSFLLTGGLSVTNNNSALAQQLKTVPFQSAFGRASNDTLQTTVINSDDVYIVPNYRTFLSPALEAGIVVGAITCHPYLRFRVSVQQYLPTQGNEYTPTIWTLGVPVTLLDKEKKPKVNFEPQMRLFNGVRSIGINVGVPFGEWLN